MTAIAPARDRPAGARRGPVPWRRMAWVTWRLHRLPLLAALGVAVAVAAAYAVSGIAVRHGMSQPQWDASPAAIDLESAGVLAGLALPLLAGLFPGAPLLAREAEHRTLALAWTQGAGRTRWLLGQVVPVGALLAGGAAAIGAETSWWLGTAGTYRPHWLNPAWFGLRPLPMAGWTLLALSLGTFLGGAIRRTVPAMAATLCCYGAVLSATALGWRPRYLPPLRRVLAVRFSPDGYSWSFSPSGMRSLGLSPDILGSRLIRPDGRPLSLDAGHPAAWYRLHHIKLLVTYQPASRYGLFQLIELGWLVAASAVLIAATAVLIRRHRA